MKQYNSRLQKFSNETMFKKWKNTNQFTKITFEKYKQILRNNIILEQDLLYNYKRYSIIWEIFMEIVEETRIIIDNMYNLYKDLYHIPGCSNISKEFYQFCAEINTTITFNDTDSFEDLLLWGYMELDHVIILFNNTIDKYDINLKRLDFNEKIIAINNNKDIKYKSKEECVNSHNEKMNHYMNFFVKQHNFPLAKQSQPKIVTFDDKSLAGGYWENDTFYLNISSYNKTNKFETNALILHETIPGHHLQLSNMIHMNKTNTILYSWFPKFINGNCEGWGLFAEQLGYDIDNFSYLGVMSMHLLRTLRVIADISIHYYKIDPERLIKLFEYYLQSVLLYSNIDFLEDINGCYMR
jgi:hypothetical protein